jgi:hypothetical protein
VAIFRNIISGKSAVTIGIPDYALRMARMLEEAERQRRQLDAVRDMLQPSAAQLAIEASIARDSALLGRFHLDPALTAPLGLGSAAEAALLALEKGALMKSFEIRPEWLSGILGLNEGTRDAVRSAQGLLGHDITRALGTSSDVARLFATTQDASRVVLDAERRWKDLIAPSVSAMTAWKDLTALSNAASDTWANFARVPERLALMTPRLAQAPGIEVYLATRASSLVIDGPEAFTDELGGDLESEVALIADSFDVRLGAFDPYLLSMYRGGVERIERAGADWARQALISFRELVMHLLHILAPDSDMAGWAQPHHYDKGKPTRHARLEFIFRDVDEGDFADFMKMDYKTAIKLFDLLNKIHKKELELTEPQFRVLRYRIQGFVNTLLEAAGR